MGRVGADDGAVLVVGEVGIVRLVVGVSVRGRTVLGFRVARSTKEVGSAGETTSTTAAAAASATAAATAAAAAAEITSGTASKGATSAPLWRWRRWLSCGVQP